MTCPHCGAQVAPGVRFCNKCRKRVAGAASTSGATASRPPIPARAPGPPRVNGGGAGFKRPAVVTLLAVLNVLGGLVGLGIAGLMGLALVDADQPEGAIIPVVFAGLYGVLAVLQLATGVGLWQLQSWGRMLQIGLAVVGLLGIPCGTIISILIIVYMVKPEVKLLFSGASPRQMDPGDVARVQALAQGSSVVVVIVGVVLLLMAIVGGGMVAAIAIPSLLRARVSANESAGIGDLRTMVSAQATYASANMGHYDTLECLVQPTGGCIPEYPAQAPEFLSAKMLESPRAGYVFTFHPGPPAPPDDIIEGRASPTSITGWAYTAVPVTPGTTGVRAFCTDQSGMICFVASGSEPFLQDGQCPGSDMGCEPLM